MINDFLFLLFYLYESSNVYRFIYFLILKCTNEFHKVHESTCICVCVQNICMILAIRYPQKMK